MIDISKLTIEEVLDLKMQLSRIKIKGEPVENQNGAMDNRLERANGWDWTKTSAELAIEHNCSYALVNKYRYMLGKPKVTKWAQKSETWDWSKSDTQIARENKIDIGSVRNWRKKLHKPPAPRDYETPTIKAPRPEEVWAGFDWEKPDIEIAKDVGLTRERIRQIRARLGKPKFKWHEVNFERFCKALEGVKEITFKDCQTKFKCGVETFRNYCYRAKIKVIKKALITKTPWQLMNFDLPGNELNRIWKLRFNGSQGRRCNYHLQKPAFRSLKGIVPDEFKPLIVAEEQKAAEYFATKQ